MFTKKVKRSKVHIQSRLAGVAVFKQQETSGAPSVIRTYDLFTVYI